MGTSSRVMDVMYTLHVLMALPLTTVHVLQDLYGMTTSITVTGPALHVKEVKLRSKTMVKMKKLGKMGKMGKFHQVF